MQSHIHKSAGIISIASALFLFFCGLAQAQELDGKWKLTMSKGPDGTTQTPPAVLGFATMCEGQRIVAVVWHTPKGKPAHFSLTSNYKLSGNEWTETLLFSVLDDGSGKPPVYNVQAGTKSVPVTREGTRIAFKHPFEPVSSVIEGDKWTATIEGGEVHYWERVR
jgi:hypothetical protein